MADTAAFFAKKKTKKKKFKAFNANKIDASQISTDVHVDAPEISAEEVVAAGLGGLSVAGRSAGASPDEGGGDDQWADNTATWGLGGAAPAAAGGTSKVAELLDMRALSEQRKGEDDVAERLRIEETKAQLARAKEGMAKEAERMAAEKEAKEAKKQGGGPVAPSGGLGGGGAGGKWVPSHMRGGGGGSSIRGPASMPSVRGPASMDGSGFQRPVDTACEELFPDLADADKIMKEKEEREAKEVAANTVSSSQPVRAPAGWGARMGPPGGVSPAPAQRRPLNLTKPAERKPLNLSAPSQKEEPAVAKVEPAPAPAADEKPKKEEESEPEKKSPEPSAPKPEAAPTPAAPKVEKKLKKKKKKDLSTFKAKS